MVKLGHGVVIQQILACLEKVVLGLKPPTAYVLAVGTSQLWTPLSCGLLSAVGSSLCCFSSSCLISRIVLNVLFLTLLITPTAVPPLLQAESHLLMISLVREWNPPQSRATLTLITDLSKEEEAWAMLSLVGC